MPVASSSRRRNVRRQASSDIEEDHPTQRGAQEEVDEDEEEQPRRKNVKKERTSAKKAKVEKGTVKANNSDDDDDDDDRIDIANFRNQPLRKADATKLQGLTKDWESLRQNIAQNFKHVRSVAISVADATEPDQGAKVSSNSVRVPMVQYLNDIIQSLIELEMVMKNLIDIDEEMRSHSSTLDDLYQKVYQDEEIVSMFSVPHAAGLISYWH